MTYYHVIIKCNSNGSTSIELFRDLTSVELKEKFVKPYLKGYSILSENDQIDVFSITNLMIIETDDKSDVVRNRIYEESLRRIDQMNSEGRFSVCGSGSGYQPEDIKEGGIDVTSQFITGPVGSKKGQPWYVALLLTVLAGVLIAGIIWRLGWK